MADDTVGLIDIIAEVLTTFGNVLVWLFSCIPLAAMTNASLLVVPSNFLDNDLDGRVLVTAVIAALHGMFGIVPCAYLKDREGWSAWRAVFAILFAEFCLVVLANVIGWGLWAACHWQTVVGKGKEMWTKLNTGLADGRDAGNAVDVEVGLMAVVAVPVKEQQ
ncbi:hypothetical protein EJ03DRAFT_328275 [Teratosphaeria nubilosa]|uniref:Uncharacterized protein n=1 Tax=Teratosphaeria nubilosa TaxID=161662 RepID=A0A6G1L6C4_9PEZI|nr:hypothetical protein EJ03DRAFT_328275 [Teratosphaeria nubilosa]